MKKLAFVCYSHKLAFGQGPPDLGLPLHPNHDDVGGEAGAWPQGAARPGEARAASTHTAQTEVLGRGAHTGRPQAGAGHIPQPQSAARKQEAKADLCRENGCTATR